MKRAKVSSSLRVFFWGLKLFLLRHKAKFFSILFLVFGFWFLVFYQHFIKKPTRTAVFKIGFVAQVNLPSDLPKAVSEILSSGLTDLTSEGEATASLALKWEQDSEGKEFTFILKPSLFWTDKKSLISSDLKFDIPDVSISFPSADKITFRLKNPFSPFPVLVSQPVFKNTSFVGTGPCLVNSVERKQEVVNRLLVSCPQQNSLLEIRFYPSEEDGLLALNLGEIKALFGVRKLRDKLAWSNFNFYQKKCCDCFVAVFYNLRDSFLAEKNVRQALTLAIPKEEFANRALGPISFCSWAYNKNLKGYEFNLEEAGALLEETQLPSELKLWTTPAYLDLAQRIATSWEKLGFKVVVETKTSKEVNQKNFQALLIGQEISFDPDQYSLWHSTQETNITGLKSPKIDKYLEDGRETFDKEKRKEIYQDFQKYLVEECPAAFLYYPVEYILISKKIDSPTLRQIFKISE